MTTATSGWQAGMNKGEGRRCGPRGSRRTLEIVGIVAAFFYFWPAAIAWVAWKLMGYPGLDDLRGTITDRAADLRAYRFTGASGFGGFAGTGNLAFDEYRREAIERLERERRRLDEEAREFRTFVDDLKRAKDREEFDAYMARRRKDGPVDV